MVENYREPLYVLESEREEMIEVLQPRESDIVLDVATGPGYQALALTSRVKKVYGIDNKPELITIAKERATHEGVDNVEFSVGVAQKIDYPDNFFDIVTCRLAFHHLTEPMTVLGEINRVLKPDGKFNMSDPILSEYAQAVWVPVNRLRESDFYCYHTYLALVQMLNQSGFKIASIRPFTFKRVLDKWVKDRDEWVPERIKEVVLGLDERVLKELRFTKTSEEGWVWYYNCLDILTMKKTKPVDELK